MNPLSWLGIRAKAAGSAAVAFPRTRLVSWLISGSRDYVRQAGTGRQNSIVEACVRWIMRTFPEAPAIALQLSASGDPKPLRGHPLTKLLRRPNAHYGGETLWSATVADYALDGNAYWLKLRAGGGSLESNTTGEVVALWYVPHTVMEPKWPDDDPTVFISHYEYNVGGTVPLKVDPANVVHFRNGLDPQNIRKGLGPIKALAREIVSDDEAAQWIAALLHNMGIPGVIIVPGKDVEIDQDEREEIKQLYLQKTTGDKRGEPLVMDNAVDIKTLGFSPEQMMPEALRNIPETRISGVLGVPAIVAGLDVGLKRSTFSNYGEARQAGYRSCLIPMQRQMAGDLAVQLVPDFGDAETLDVEFDTSKVQELQEDEGALFDRAVKAAGGPILTVDEARAMVHLQPLPNNIGDAIYVPGSASPTPLEEFAAPAPEPPPQLVPPPQPPQLPPPQGQGDQPPPQKARRLKAVSAGPQAVNVEAWVREFHAIRDKLTSGALDDLETFFADQRDRIVAALHEAGDGASVNDLLDAAVEEASLKLALEPHYLETLKLIQNAVQTQLGVRYTFTEHQVQAYLRDAGSEIRGITATTRDAVRDALITGADRGESPAELSARLRDLPAFGRARANVVARTEMGNAANEAAYHNYAASDVVDGVTILDGDEDEICADADGTELSLEDAKDYPRLGHPNCVRAFSPRVAA